MKSLELKSHRQHLADMVRRLSAEKSRLRRAVFNDVDGPEAGAIREQYANDDVSREDTDEAVALSLLANEEGLLTECEAALERIDSGTFGRCVSCGQAVGKSRLAAMPYARRCIRCERAAEAGIS